MSTDAPSTYWGDPSRYDSTPHWGGQGGGGAVSSVFGRTGAVSAQAGDYDASQIANLRAHALAVQFAIGG